MTINRLHVLDAFDPENEVTAEQAVPVSPYSGGAPSWAPDGQRIALESFGVPSDQIEADSASQIYVVNADGSDLKQLTDSDTNQMRTWSPEGSKIAFVSLRSGVVGIFIHER